MKIEYYGPEYPADTEEHKRVPFEPRLKEYFEAVGSLEGNPEYYLRGNEISRNPWCYRNFVMSSTIGPKIDWRFHWRDGDEEAWEGFIGKESVAYLHRGSYSLTYGVLDENDAWNDSKDCFFYYAYLRVLEAAAAGAD